MISSITDIERSSSSLHDRIRRARLSQQMTRTEPAKRIGVVPSAAAQWEHPSGTSPSVSNLISIAKITGVAFEWLATARGPVRLDAAAAESSALSQICIAMDLFEEEVLMTVRRIPQKHRDVWLHCLQTVYPRT